MCVGMRVGMLAR